MKIASSESTYLHMQKNGHEYHIQQSLGTFSILSPKQLMTDLKMGKVFPLAILDGDLAQVKSRAKLGIPGFTCLSCLPLFANEVEVIEQTDTAIRLQACTNHVFRDGTVTMRIEKLGNELIYHIDGYGHENETSARYYANLLFANAGLWHLFIRMNVIPYARQLEDRLAD